MPGDRDGHTFLFADLAGFTALTEAHGDERAADLVSRFCGEVSALLPAGAEQVKSMGDAVLVRVPDAADAVRLGVRIVEEVGGRHEFPVVRVGMHSGPAVQRDGDWFGSTLNVAARVAGAAEGGEVLLTQATRELAQEPAGIALDDRGARRLRNVGEPIGLHRARREGSTPRTLPVDPVCRMAVEAGLSVRVEQAGQELHFCSEACADAFRRDPELYVDVRTAPGARASGTRASDAEREVAVARLSRAGADGRLVLEEVVERIEAALQSLTREELAALTSDLPVAEEQMRRGKRRRWTLAVMSGSEQRGRWRAGGRLGALALMGGAVIDLRHAELTEPDVHVLALAIMGGVRIVVPEGVVVRGSGLAIMGGNDFSKPGAEAHGMPTVHVRALSLMGGVKVVCARRDAGEPAAPPRIAA